MTEKEKKELHGKKSDDTRDKEVSQEDIDKTVSEIEDVGRGAVGPGREAASSVGTAKGDNAGDHDTLLADLEKARQEAKDNYELHLRSAAELDNYRKRIRKEAEEGRRFANEELIKELIPVVDNLERALVHGEGNSDPGALLDGVKMVHKQFMDTLARHGVEEVMAIGEPFDPNFHQALMQVKTSNAPPNTVVSEITKGYLLNGRLIRPSMVGVSVTDPEEGPGEGREPRKGSPWGDEEYEVDENGVEKESAVHTSEDEDK